VLLFMAIGDGREDTGQVANVSKAQAMARE
jgi:hypothetical protein